MAVAATGPEVHWTMTGLGQARVTFRPERVTNPVVLLTDTLSAETADGDASPVCERGTLQSILINVFLSTSRNEMQTVCKHAGRV